jgi:hypothetical protein
MEHGFGWNTPAEETCSAQSLGRFSFDDRDLEIFLGCVNSGHIATGARSDNYNIILRHMNLRKGMGIEVGKLTEALKKSSGSLTREPLLSQRLPDVLLFVA